MPAVDGLDSHYYFRTPAISMTARSPLSLACPLSPSHTGFRLYVNKSYSALTATPGQLDEFASSTSDAIAIAFRGPLSKGEDPASTPSLTEVYIGPIYPSSWPDATQGKHGFIWDPSVSLPLALRVPHSSTPHPIHSRH